MKEMMRSWIKPLVFTLLGAAAGYAYYRLVGCSTGGCIITSSPYTAIAYMGLMGWLLSGAFGKGCEGGCSM